MRRQLFIVNCIILSLQVYISTACISDAPVFVLRQAEINLFYVHFCSAHILSWVARTDWGFLIPQGLCCATAPEVLMHYDRHNHRMEVFKRV